LRLCPMTGSVRSAEFLRISLSKKNEKLAFSRQRFLL